MLSRFLGLIECSYWSDLGVWFRQVLAVKMQSEKKSSNATWLSLLFIVSHSGVDFWKVFALGLFFASHGAVGFWKVLVHRSPRRCCGRFWLGKLTEQKK